MREKLLDIAKVSKCRKGVSFNFEVSNNEETEEELLETIEIVRMMQEKRGFVAKEIFVETKTGGFYSKERGYITEEEYRKINDTE